jgi:hypothetical protein
VTEVTKYCDIRTSARGQFVYRVDLLQKASACVSYHLTEGGARNSRYFNEIQPFPVLVWLPDAQKHAIVPLDLRGERVLTTM